MIKSTAFKQNKIIPIVRENSYKDAIEKIERIVNLGFKVIEVTFTTPEVKKLIKHIKKNCPGIVVAAGTVSSEKEATEAKDAGVDFMVSPYFVEKVSLFCQKNAILYIPGAMTMQEIFNIRTKGWNIVKIFPATIVGKDFIKQITSVMPETKIMVTGGISLLDAKDWLSNSVIAAGIGSSLFKINDDEIRNYLGDINE